MTMISTGWLVGWLGCYLLCRLLTVDCCSCPRTALQPQDALLCCEPPPPRQARGRLEAPPAAHRHIPTQPGTQPCQLTTLGISSKLNLKMQKYIFQVLKIASTAQLPDSCMNQYLLLQLFPCGGNENVLFLFGECSRFCWNSSSSRSVVSSAVFLQNHSSE